MTQFLLDTHRQDDAVVVVVSGEIDMKTAPTLLAVASSALTQDDVVTVRLDLSAVSFLDSSGLGVLVTLHERAVGCGRSLIVGNLRPGQRRVIEASMLHTLLRIDPSTCDEAQR